MDTTEEIQIPQLSDIPRDEQTTTAKLLLTLCNQLSKRFELQSEQLELQSEKLGLQSEQIQMLKNEIAYLKGEHPRPKIKPSALDKDKPGGGSKGGKKKTKRGKPKRKKTKELEIHEIKEIHPENIPQGAVFKGSERHKRIVTEGALVASILKHQFCPELVIVSDDAGQFNITGFLNALCWVHAERSINKIIPYSDSNREAQEIVRGEIWDYYKQLKEFKNSPTDDNKTNLAKRFDEIFTQTTCFQILNLALKKPAKSLGSLSTDIYSIG